MNSEPPLTNMIGQTQFGLSHKHDIAELGRVILVHSNFRMNCERMTVLIVNDMYVHVSCSAVWKSDTGKYRTFRWKKEKPLKTVDI